MSHQSRDASPARGPNITQNNSLGHPEDNPQAQNTSYDKVDGHGIAVFQSSSPGARNSSDICLNLDPKFSTLQGDTAPNASATADTNHQNQKKRRY